VTTLPTPLRRWQTELAAFPKDVALALAPIAARLAAAIGPMRTRVGDGEPDGFGALARCGSYERLLPTEWALADEAPDEFLRRAVSAEHLFFAPVQRGPSSRRRCVVIFDAGPTQLGAPRLVHVALLVVLARRARDAKVELAWGIAQAPSELRTDLDSSAVVALLAARSPHAVEDTRVDAWRDALRARDDEVWWVGDPRAPIPGMRHVAIEEPITLDADALEVRVGAVRLRLARPADPIETRLIRAPFDTSAAPPTAPTSPGRRDDARTIPRHASFALPLDGRRLAVRMPDGFLSWGIPSSPREPLGAPRRLRVRPNETLLAAGHHGRKIYGVALRLDDRALVTYGVDLARFGSAVPCPFPHPAPDEVLRVANVDLQGRLVWETGAGTLCRNDGKSPLEARRVIGFRGGRETRLVEERGEGTSAELSLVVWGPPDRVLYRTSGARTVVFGDGAVAFGPHLDASSDRAWHVVTDTGREADLIAPPGTRVIGALGSPVPALVVVEPDERTIVALRATGPAASLRTSGPIEDVVCHGDVVAWRTRFGVLEVGSFTRGGVLMRLESEAP
jgi:hypothetical protein